MARGAPRTGPVIDDRTPPLLPGSVDGWIWLGKCVQVIGRQRALRPFTSSLVEAASFPARTEDELQRLVAGQLLAADLASGHLKH